MDWLPDQVETAEKVRGKASNYRRGPSEVIEISDDIASPERASGSVVPARNVPVQSTALPLEVDPATAAELSWPSGTVDMDIREYPEALMHSRVVYSEHAQRVMQRFVRQVMRRPRGGFTKDIQDIVAQLRGYLVDLAGAIQRWETEPEVGLLGPGQTLANSMLFGLKDVTVIHSFLADVVNPPRGGFDGSVNGIRHQMVAHAPGLEVLRVQRGAV